MSANKPTLVFFGNERLATGVTTQAPTLRSLVQAGYHIGAVVSHYEQSRSRNGRDLEIGTVAAEYNIPLLLPEKPGDILEKLAAYNAEIGVLVAYGKIVPQSVIDLFPRGIVNIHPSLLPLHRGPIPLESVILEGADETGVSIMELVRAMDAGPTYDQINVSLRGDEAKQELADTLLEHGKNMLIKALPRILDGSLQSKPQDDTHATYDALINKADGLLDSRKSAVQLEREVRAYAEWPKSRIVLGNVDVVVTKAHVEAENTRPIGTMWLQGKQFGIQTSRGVLVMDELKPAGKSAMSAESFLAGYRHLLAF